MVKLVLRADNLEEPPDSRSWPSHCTPRPFLGHKNVELSQKVFVLEMPSPEKAAGEAAWKLLWEEQSNVGSFLQALIKQCFVREGEPLTRISATGG
jgi:hypothetical protein